jgi:hypothetical protein
MDQLVAIGHDNLLKMVKIASIKYTTPEFDTSNLKLANSHKIGVRLNWRRLYLKKMLLEYTYNKFDVDGRRRPATQLEVYEKFLLIFFDSMAPPAYKIHGNSKKLN